MMKRRLIKAHSPPPAPQKKKEELKQSFHFSLRNAKSSQKLYIHEMNHTPCQEVHTLKSQPLQGHLVMC